MLRRSATGQLLCSFLQPWDLGRGGLDEESRDYGIDEEVGLSRVLATIWGSGKFVE